MIAVDEIRKRLHDEDEDARRQAVLDLAGEGSEEAYRLLVTALGDSSWRVRKTAAELIEGGRDKARLLPALIDSLGCHDNAGLRNSAAEVLTVIGGPAVEVLVEAAAGEDAEVRKFSVDILGDIGEESCVETLANSLRDPDENVKGAASEALGKIGGERAVKALLAILEDDDLWVRFATLEALGRIRVGIPVEPVAPFLEDRILRKAAIDALAGSTSAEAVPYLVSALEDKGAASRASAVEALASVFGTLDGEEREGAVRKIRSDVDPEVLSAVLDSPFREAKKSAARLLAVIGRMDFPEKLLDLAGEEEVEEDVRSVFKGMGKKGVRMLLDALPKSADLRRAFILSILGEMGGDVGDDEVLPTLIKSLKDPYGHARKAALVSIGRLEAVDALPAIIALLCDEYEDVEEAAVLAIELIGRRSPAMVVKLLTESLRSPDARMRTNVVTIIGSVGGTEAVPALKYMVKDEKSEVRKAAVASLGEIGVPSVVDSLATALSDEDKGVKLSAVNALGKVDDPRSEQLLALTSMDEDMWVRCAALRSLAMLGSDGAFATISKAVLDAAGVVAITAIELLAGSFADRAEASLKKALEHDDPQVVKVALEKLKAL